MLLINVVFLWFIQIFLSGFFNVKIYALGRSVSLFFLSCECETGT